MTRLLVAGLVAVLLGQEFVTRPKSATGSQAEVIVLDVGVEDANGIPVTTLTAADFEILVDSVPRPLASFSSDNRPLRIAVLVDVSASMTTEPLSVDDRYRRTLESIVRELETGDRATLGRVSGKPAIASIASDNATTLFKQISEVLKAPDIERFGPSPLWDSMIFAMERIAAETGLRAVMLWTDGRSTGNRFAMADVIDRAVASGVSVHVVVEHFPQPASSQQVRSDPCAAVMPIAAATGGSCLLNRRGGALNVAPIEPARRVLTSLHRRYVLGFEDDRKDGQMHALEVRVNRSGVVVRAPLRYRAEK